MKHDRESRILEMLSEKERIDVSTLAEALGVSQVTIRKDLDQLERKAIIRREHGAAVLCSEDDINGRIAIHYQEKLKIARKAAELVQDGDAIMIESGSCCAMLAEVLAETRKDLTLITNSSFIASYIRGKARFQVILLGGICQPEAQVNVGPMVRECARNFFVKHFFIGVDGYSERTGFTNQDQMRAQAVRDMALQAENIVVVTESEKCSRHGIIPLNLPDEAERIVITDDRLDPQVRARLESHHTRVIEAA